MDLKDALFSKGVKFRQAGAENEIWMCCPFCGERGEGEDTRFRLGVNTKSGLARCFNCDWKTRNALEILGKKLILGEIQAGEGTTTNEPRPKPVLPDDFEVLTRRAARKDEWVAKARKYIRERNITSEQILDKQIGVSLVGRYAYRIIFPVTFEGELQGFLGRDFIGKSSRKYLNTPGMRSLYNVPWKRRKSFLLAEGVIKALYLESTLEVHAGALLGHSITPTQEDMLKGFSDIVLWPDPDRVGVKGFLQVAQQLSTRFKVWWPSVMPSAQADEMSKKDIKSVMKRMAPFGPMAELKAKKYLMDLRRDD